MHTYFYLLPLLLFSRSSWGVEESNCQDFLPSTEILEFYLFIHVSLEMVPDTGGTDPSILEVNYTCLAQGTLEGNYRALSVMIMYYQDFNSTTINAAHFQLLCYNSEWVLPTGETIDNITGSVATLETRFDCRSCRSGLNPHRCIPCSVDCGGLGRCTDNAGLSCCAFFEDGACNGTRILSRVTPFPYRGVSHELLTLECHVNDTRYSVIWAELLSSEGINVITNTNQYRISGNSLTFTPYAHNLFAQLAYFPQQYPFLSSIVEVDMETWIDITPIAYILCGAEIAVGEGPVDTLPVLSNNNVTYHHVTFQITENGPYIYNNSIINNDLNDTNITIYCRSIYGSENLKFSSDNTLLDNYFNGEDFLGAPPLVINSTTVIIHQLTDYDLVLSIAAYSAVVNGKISCYSQSSGESTTVLLTNDTEYIEVASYFEAMLGIRALLPFRAALMSDGDSFNTSNTVNNLYIIEPNMGEVTSMKDLELSTFFQTSPYNFGLFMNPATLANEGIYEIGFSDSSFNKAAMVNVVVPPNLFLVTPMPNVVVAENSSATLNCSPSVSDVMLMWIAEVPLTQTLFNTTRYDIDACLDEFCHSIYIPIVTRGHEGRYFCYVRGDRVSIIENIDDPFIDPAIVTLTLDIDAPRCQPEVDAAWGIYWPVTDDGVTSVMACPGTNVAGEAMRTCSGREWMPVDVSSCIAEEFSMIQEEADGLFSRAFDELNDTESGLLTALIEDLTLATMRNESLFPLELAITNDIINNTIVVLLTVNIDDVNITDGIVESLFDVLSNILALSNTPGWESLQDTNPSMGSELLLRNAENLGLYLANTLVGNDLVTISRGNIVIRAQNFVVENDTVFPDLTFPDPDDLTNFMGEATASITIPSDLLERRSIGRSDLPVVHILFNNLQEFLEASNTRMGIETGSLIISSQVAVQRGDDVLTTPVTIAFDIIVENFTEPECVFWDFSVPIGMGGWSSDGIETVFDEGTQTVTCLSSHLTSFAVLVDVAGTTTAIPSEEALALSIVTYVGLAISIVCLVLTVIFFLSFGKQLFTSVHYFVHLNFALSLLLAYIVFAVGIETATGNKGACTFVAALLHYLFLSAFCWMLCEGIMLYLMLVVVFSSLSKKWWFFLIIGWVPSLVVVVITVGATSDFYTDGEDFCWISVSENVIWAFVVPMLIIIMINVMFLALVLVAVLKNKLKGSKKSQENANNIDLVKSLLKATVILLPLLGLTWVFGLLAVNRQTTVFAWIFLILNSLQGLAIFFFHVVRHDKVWNAIVKLCKKRQDKDSKARRLQPNTGSTSDGLSTLKHEDDELAPVVYQEKLPYDESSEHKPLEFEPDEKPKELMQLKEEPSDVNYFEEQATDICTINFDPIDIIESPIASDKEKAFSNVLNAANQEIDATSYELSFVDKKEMEVVPSTTMTTNDTYNEDLIEWEDEVDGDYPELHLRFSSIKSTHSTASILK